MNELEYLRDRSLLIVDFIIEKTSGDSLIKKLRPIIQEAYAKNNLKGLRTASRDMNAWAKDLPQKDIKEIELLLAEKFGENLSGDKITHTVIKKALKEKEIENNEGYRVIHEYLIDIAETDPYYKNIAELEALLVAYQEK